MIPISVALKATLASPHNKLCTLLRVARTDGVILGFTDNAVPVTYNDGSGSIVYSAAYGYTRKDVSTALDLSVDGTDYDGLLTSPSITEADLHAGIWDFAAIRLYLVNPDDLTQGHVYLRRGWLGKVTVRRSAFTAELRGLMQAYSRTIGELISPSCRAQLYDARCKVDPTAFTVTGTLTGVTGGGLTVQDTGRTEPGPTASTIVIASISKSNPGHVTLASGGGATLETGEPVMLSAIAGGVDFPTLNASTFVRNLSGDVFDLGIDTTNYTGTYTASSGRVTPLGADSGYFDFGIMTMMSGLNNGLSMEVTNYIVGQWTLVLPFPYALQIGDTYSMRAGCDLSMATCKTKFSNVANMRAEPYLPGIDKIVQVGKQ